MPKRSNSRALDRPNDGDSQTCPFCRALIYFKEPTGDETQPGWFCKCGYQILVRQPAKPSFEERRRAMTERGAKLLRKPMIMRSHSERLRKESDRIRGRGKK